MRVHILEFYECSYKLSLQKCSLSRIQEILELEETLMCSFLPPLYFTDLDVTHGHISQWQCWDQNPNLSRLYCVSTWVYITSFIHFGYG